MPSFRLLDAKLKLQTEMQDLKVTSVSSSAKHSGELLGLLGPTRAN